MYSFFFLYITILLQSVLGAGALSTANPYGYSSQSILERDLDDDSYQIAVELLARELQTSISEKQLRRRNLQLLEDFDQVDLDFNDRRATSLYPRQNPPTTSPGTSTPPPPTQSGQSTSLASSPTGGWNSQARAIQTVVNALGHGVIDVTKANIATLVIGLLGSFVGAGIAGPHGGPHDPNYVAAGVAVACFAAGVGAAVDLHHHPDRAAVGAAIKLLGQSCGSRRPILPTSEISSAHNDQQGPPPPSIPLSRVSSTAASPTGARRP